METPTWVAYGVLSLVTVTLTLLFNHLIGHHRKLNQPPGPRPWPVIGNLNLMSRLPHRTLHELSKRYGPIMMLHYGSVRVLVGSSMEMARLILKTHDEIFAGRPKMAAGKYITEEYSGMLWTQDSPYLHKIRKICLLELFSSKRLESFKYIRVEEMSHMLRDMYRLSLSGEPMLLRDRFMACNLNTICRMVVGKKYVDDGESSMRRIQEFKEMFDEFFVLTSAFNLGDWIPFFKHLDVQGYVKRMKALGKKFYQFWEHVLDEHDVRREKEKENWVAKDMVDVLLELANDPNVETKVERKGIKGIIQDLIIGGSESSPTVLEWAMVELLRHPTIITKAIEELDRVVGRNRWAVEEDTQNLPYIRSIVKEVLRLHPVAPTLAPHFSKEDIQIQGYHIPKGSIVLVNIFTIQRDPNTYDRSEEFFPERFIKKKIDLRGQHFELLPFGSGRRMCPAYSHGMKVVETTLANLLHGFAWKLPNNMKPVDLDMEEKFGITAPKKIPLAACAEPRLARHLYHTL